MAPFVGRERELATLTTELDRVRAGAGDAKPGRCMLLRGRRRVGKSRLVEELCRRADVPYFFFTASQQGPRELALFTAEIADSTLSNRESISGVTPESWDGALRLLATAVGQQASIVVVDELPYLVDDDPTLEATLQKLWDRTLSELPVLLILVGSDLAMMEALDTHGRAFFQRGRQLVVPPFSPLETGEIVGSPTPADAFDAYLVTGGLPLICDEWPRGLDLWGYLDKTLSEPASALAVSAERTLAAELDGELNARRALEAIGSGERTFTAIGQRSGVSAMTLTRSLDALRLKRIVARETPLSTRKGSDPRYRIEDPYLRFWLRFIGPHMAEIDRGRGDRVLRRTADGWPSWRGRAIEPVIREALRRRDPTDGLVAPGTIGSYWTRSNDPEVDIIAADTSPVAKELLFAGSIKWRDNSPFDMSDLAALAANVQRVPGGSAATPLMAVSRSGTSAQGLAAALGPDDLIEAWKLPDPDGAREGAAIDK